MRNTCCPRLVTLSALLFLCSIASPAENSFDYVVTVGNEQLHFVAQPELGYVFKSSRNNSAVLSLNSTSQITRSEDSEYLNVANRPDIRIVISQQTLIQNQRNIRILSNQPDTEYVAPIYTIEGETVAIIPEIIVRLYHETDRSKLEELCLGIDCTIIRNLLYTEQEFLISPTAQNAEDVLTTVEIFDSADFVEWAWPNIAFQPKLCGLSEENKPDRIEPDDEYFNKQWHLDAIRAPEAWYYADNTGDPNIVVAVLDDDVDIKHPDLINNIWTNANEVPDNGIDDDENGFIDDVHGWDFADDSNGVGNNLAGYSHGTACAGLIAAQGNNNLGVTGVTWNCTIMPVPILPYSGCTTMVEPVEGLKYAAAQGADVISNSWGYGGGVAGFVCQYVHSAIKDVTRPGGIGRDGKGCVVFFASGNSRGLVDHPAKHPEVIAVGAIDQNDIIWDYSCHGPGLDIVAPSGCANTEVCDSISGLWTTDESGPMGDGNTDTSILDYTDKMDGTSGACPIAAGVAALILSVDPTLTNIEVLNILSHSARDLGLSGWDEYYGFGCVDAYAAVTMAQNPPEFILFVDDDALNDPGPGDPNVGDPLEDGSEEHPFDAIQEAIDHAFHGDTVIVLPGTYVGNGNRDIDFSGRIITVRSQDGPTNCTIDCEATGRGFHFHTEEGTSSVVDGFTIKNGWAAYGGGMYNDHSHPTITNCMFTGNSAENGAGMYNLLSNPVITNCTFNRNSATSTTGNISYYYGGGMYNSSSTPIINYCTFKENTAERGAGMYNHGGSLSISNSNFAENSSSSYGGGIYNVDSNPIITDCNFAENESSAGGGIYNTDSSEPVVAKCTFTGNSATGSGGGIYNKTFSNPTIMNCIFTGNSANSTGGGIYYNHSNDTTLNNCTLSSNYSVNGYALAFYSSKKMYPSKIDIVNCILWNGGNEIWNDDNSNITISYSNISGGYEGEGNIDVDPLFADADNGDYHLKSEMGRWNPNSESWIQDDVTSPCIDAGDPNSDWSCEIWPHGERINMGAYGGTRQASMSLETEGMSLPLVAYIYSRKDEVAESFQSLLGIYGCSTTLISLDDVPATPLDSYDLLIVANDTENIDTWSDPNTVAAIEDSNKPVVGLGEGGYTFFGELGLAIGYPNGAHGIQNSIEVIDPNSSLFSMPYSIEIPQDRALQLYTETDHVGLYLWPIIPETVTALAGDVNNFPYYPLATEYDLYLLWGFTESPEKMTEIGKTLFINVVIWTANKAWESKI